MLDLAIREVLLALVSTLIPLEPSIAPGAATVREKAARTALSAIAAPEDYPVGMEQPPAAGAPPADLRHWLVRFSASSQHVKVLAVGAQSVDVRIFAAP